MWRQRLTRNIGIVLLTAGLLVPPAARAEGDWLQWGGPSRDFTVQTTGLAERWPDDGPRRLWHRELGDGYSCILYEDGVLYTMYRTHPNSHEERVVALDAATGNNLWEHVNRARLSVRPDERWGGLGPNATPLIVGDRLFAPGSNAHMLCLDKKDGKVLWSRDLAADYGAPYPNGGEVGYSASPLAYENLLIVSVGRKEAADAPRGQSMIALDQETGKEVWRGMDYLLEFSSPKLIRFDGEDQLVQYATPGLVGVNPATGRELWRVPLAQRGAISSPVFDGRDLLFCIDAQERPAGTAIKLAREGGKTVPEIFWASRKVRLSVPTPVIVDGHLYGCTDQILFRVDMATGKRTWVERGFPDAAIVHADGKLIILDVNGKLTLATPATEGLTIHSQCQITEKYSFTVPTLVGKTLYVRDRKHIMALDLR